MSRTRDVPLREENPVLGAVRWSVLYLALCAAAFLTALPFVWMVLGSFKTRQEVENPGFVPERWKPAAFAEEAPSPDNNPYAFETEFDNYLIVLGLEEDRYTGEFLNIDFLRWYYNSFFTSAAITFLQVLTSAMAAYAFARMAWPGRDQVFFLYLATMMIPGVVLMIPNFQLMILFGFVDTYRGLILPAAFTAFGTFLLRQFMLTIPPSIDEAARIDGASHWQTFWEVILPLTKAGMVALAIFTMLGAFQSFFWPLVMLKRDHLFTLPIGLLNLDTTYGRQTEFILAATVMSILPLVILFVALQKQLIKGIQLGAVKG